MQTSASFCKRLLQCRICLSSWPLKKHIFLKNTLVFKLWHMYSLQWCTCCNSCNECKNNFRRCLPQCCWSRVLSRIFDVEWTSKFCYLFPFQTGLSNYCTYLPVFCGTTIISKSVIIILLWNIFVVCVLSCSPCWIDNFFCFFVKFLNLRIERWLAINWTN